MNLSFELFKDIRNIGTVLKRRDMIGCIPNLKITIKECEPKLFEVNIMNK